MLKAQKGDWWGVVRSEFYHLKGSVGEREMDTEEELGKQSL